jgi:hypothetical protein
MISATDMSVLRSIARAGDDYEEIKRYVVTQSWKIVEDELDLGYMQVTIPSPTGSEEYRLIIGYRDPQRPPYLLLSFFLFPDSQENIPAFNWAFRWAADVIGQILGPATVTGKHQLSFRSWPYAYHRWSLPEAEFTLIQDEFDVQDGLDITLWIQPVGTSIEETLHSSNS